VDIARHGNARQGKAKARQGKNPARRGKARQGATAQLGSLLWQEAEV